MDDSSLDARKKMLSDNATYILKQILEDISKSTEGDRETMKSKIEEIIYDDDPTVLSELPESGVGKDGKLKTKGEKKEKRSIIETIDERSLLALRSAFKVCPSGTMTRAQLENWLKVFCPYFCCTDEEKELMYKKMDPNLDRKVTWNEFLDYLALECKEKNAVDVELGPDKDLPITELPTFFKSGHRHPVFRITFNPSVTKERQTSFSCGKYITMSQDGIIHSWSLNMDMEKTWVSSSFLVSSQTWLLDLACLSDMNIICTSSSAGDLRFYDITADEFSLRTLITSMDESANTLCYHFHNDINKNSILILGDTGGNLILLSMKAGSRGPFKQKPGYDYLIYRYSEVLKGEVEGLTVQEIHGLHQDWVHQIAFYKSLNYIVSCARTSTRSLVLTDLLTQKPKLIFNIDHGVSCFAIDESSHKILTGGSDCTIKLWSTFVTNEPIITFLGHRAAIVAVVPLLSEFRIYSISKDRVIKVWDYKSKDCIQTFSEQLSDLGNTTGIATIYNPIAKKLIVGGLKIAVVKFQSGVNQFYSDGCTHSDSVTKALFNPVFQYLVTIGMDSSIMTWNPWTGERIASVRNAHTKEVVGEKQPLGITAAIFDPQKILLLTGAIDGSIKMWNCSSGTCLRKMTLRKNCAVTNLGWIPTRIFGTCWDRQMSEWEDSIEPGQSKVWRGCCEVDVFELCLPTCIAIASYSGELAFFRLDTGQVFKKYNVLNDGQRLKRSLSRRRKSSLHALRSEFIKGDMKTTERRNKAPRRVSEVTLPFENTQALAVQTMFYLSGRPQTPDVGTLLVSLENGWIQLWSPHPLGGFVSKFYAVHTFADIVITMASDSKHKYLFTGHIAGYVKAWMISRFGIHGPYERISMPLLRLKFPFLLEDRFEGRAKRTVRGQATPMLLSSYKAHTSSVTSIELIESSEIVVTCGFDRSVRLWTYGGQYIGTLGMEKPWPNLIQNEIVPLTSFRIPPDLKRVASSTTLKVLTYGWAPEKKEEETQEEIKFRKTIEKRQIKNKVYDHVLPKPVLGKYFESPKSTSKIILEPKLDMKSMPKVRVLCHMNTYDLTPIVRPRTPESLRKSRGKKEKRTS